MSTLSQNPGLDYTSDYPRPSAFSDEPGLRDPDEPVYWGLTLSAWVKIGVITALMVLLFRFNLGRLWLKTNPFNAASANWEHSMILPIIGLYYLYVWRDQLLRPRAATVQDAKEWTLAGTWGLITVFGLAVLALGAVAYPADSNNGGTTAILTSVAIRYGGIPFTWSVIVAAAWAAVAGGITFVARETLRRPQASDAMTAVWRLLGTWLMLSLAAWGLAFFAWVASQAAFPPIRISLAALCLLGLIALVPLRRSVALQSVSDQLNATSAAWFGGYVMLFGILFSFWGIYPGQNDFFKDIGMIIALFGVVTLVAGWRVMRIAWFPIVFLFCGVPWPDQVYSWVAGPLQQLAAKVAVKVLEFTGVKAVQSGTKIIMYGANNAVRTLNVAEACAGLRSLMTFVSVAGAIAFLSARPLWQKVVITLSAVPIAISCNVMRVSGQGLLDFYVSESWSSGFAHGFAGLVMLIPGFFLILLVCWLLDHLFVEVVDDDDRLQRSRAKRLAIATAGAGAAVAVAAPAARSQAAAVVQVPRRTPAKPAGGAATPAPAPAATTPATPAASTAAAPTSAAAPAPAAPAATRPTTTPAAAVKPKPAAAAPGTVTPAPAGTTAPKPVAAPTAAARRPAATPAAPAAAAPGAATPARPPVAAPKPAGAAPAPAAKAGAPAKPAGTAPATGSAAAKPVVTNPAAAKPAAPKPTAGAAQPAAPAKPQAAAPAAPGAPAAPQKAAAPKPVAPAKPPAARPPAAPQQPQDRKEGQ